MFFYDEKYNQTEVCHKCEAKTENAHIVNTPVGAIIIYGKVDNPKLSYKALYNKAFDL